MAVTITELSSDYIAWFDADKPMMLGENLLRTATIANEGWTASSDTSGAGGADAAGFEATHARDEFDHDVTKDSSARTGVWFLYDLGAEYEFDTIVVLNSNFATNSATVKFYAGNNAALDVTTKIGADVTPTSSRFSVVNCSLNGAGNPSTVNAQYFGFIATAAGAYTASLGEFIIGKRTQLKGRPNSGFDPDNYVSGTSRFVTDSGIGSVYSNYTNQRRLSLNLKTWEDSQKNDLRTFFKDYTQGGSKNFVYWDNPSTAPQSFNWMQFESSMMSAPQAGWTEQDFAFIAAEQGPNFLANE